MTIAAVSSDPLDGRMQSAFEDLTEWVHANKLTLNAKKTKEMILYFGKSIDKNVIPTLVVGDCKIDRVDEFKLLGVVFRSDLNWCSHVKYILAKASRRIFVITKLLRSGMSTADILTVYSSIVRSVLEYASPVWHCGLTQTQNFDRIKSILVGFCRACLLPSIFVKISILKRYREGVLRLFFLP